MELEFITAGLVVNTHGIRGEVKVLPQGVSPRMMIKCGVLYVEDKPYRLLSGRVHKGCLLAKLEGIGSIDDALKLKGELVTIRREDAGLPEGEYFDEELIGLTARNVKTGEELGQVVDILHYPAHDIYTVQGERDEFLIPAVPEFIAKLDVAGGTIDIRMMRGLGAHED